MERKSTNLTIIDSRNIHFLFCAELPEFVLEDIFLSYMRKNNSPFIKIMPHILVYSHLMYCKKRMNAK
jgi:hypothetical protein